MNNINPIYSINSCYLPSFKQKEAEKSTVSNPINTNMSMNGIDALANYNFNLINKHGDFNNIKTVKMIPIPDDISSIEGEQIYNSNGDLVCVIKEDSHYKTIYKNNDSKTIQIIDKNNNKTVKKQECYTSINNQKMISVYEDAGNGIGYQTFYETINGNLKVTSNLKNIKYPDGSIKEFIHEIDMKELRVINRPPKGTINWAFDGAIDYDEQGNIKHITKHSENSDSEIDVHSKGGQAYAVEENKISSIPNDFGEKYKNDKDLIPATIYNMPQNPEKLEGEKTYYSNGIVETNKVGDTLYSFNYDGKLTNVDFPNRKIIIEEDGAQEIKESFSDGAIKTTNIFPSGQLYVEYSKDGLRKMVNSFNGNIWSYDEDYKGKGFSIDFSKDGSIRNIHETEFEGYDY